MKITFATTLAPAGASDDCGVQHAALARRPASGAGHRMGRIHFSTDGRGRRPATARRSACGPGAMVCARGLRQANSPQFWDDHCGRDKAPFTGPVTRAPAIELTPQIAPTRHHFSFRCCIASFFQRGIAAIASSEAGTAVAIGTFARPVTGPPAIELALEISAELRYRPMQYMPCRAMCGPGPTVGLLGRT